MFIECYQDEFLCLEFDLVASIPYFLICEDVLVIFTGCHKCRYYSSIMYYAQVFKTGWRPDACKIETTVTAARHNDSCIRRRILVKKVKTMFGYKASQKCQLPRLGADLRHSQCITYPGTSSNLTNVNRRLQRPSAPITLISSFTGSSCGATKKYVAAAVQIKCRIC
ncbi:unnamed protein product [Periconia digitata]|uniref:Uncharacterized protein n=1 Tax=Periconia digitata TaxID=1303443 RepID=A0A9W4U8I5_9PLEO|nr:unnamed protein product [Periconia digitata]